MAEIELTTGTNSYCTLVEANTFFESNIVNEVWNQLTETEKIKYLISAYTTLSLIKWSDDFPPLSKSTTGTELTGASWIINAQCLEAFALFIIYSDDSYRTRLSLQLQGVTKFMFNKQIEEYQQPKRIAGLYSYDAYLSIKAKVFRYPTSVYQSVI